MLNEKSPRGLLEELLADAARIRDEARLKIHLAGKDAKDAFAHLETRWTQTIQRLEQKSPAEAEEVSRKTLEELRQSYRKIVDKL